MSIKRSILHHNVFGYPDTEGCKIPYRLNASRHHLVSNFLSDGNRYGQYSDVHTVCLHTRFEFTAMVNRDAIDTRPYQLRIYIKQTTPKK